MPESALCALADLVPGARATVVEVVADGAPDTARRLGALGFAPGTVVEVVRRAPLRDPVVYRVKDYEVCLRRAQAACVFTTEVEL
ncbi:iron transporter FeoA [Streptomyces lucensis JCM 4490]|uniref:Iron transporter FeoA n=1 Tax=Streptomyces lucensis JCM 4490 TaxID=1306176 RepID=A0A918J4E5_9ACTN|nr:iron transporter FeoA [Streptomyces lucensis JCM 4490]